jgi:hypothetical protein
MEGLQELGLSLDEARAILCNASVGIRSRMATVAKAYEQEEMGTGLFVEKVENLSHERELVESLLRRIAEEENSRAHRSLRASMTPAQREEYERQRGFM